MIRALLFGILIPSLYSQNVFTAHVLDSASLEPIAGVQVGLKGTSRGSVSDDKGVIRLTGLPNGAWTLVFSAMGYASREETFTFPPSISDLEIRLSPEAKEIEEVLVSATRVSRHIDDIPTRVEAITAEELDEKASMNSSNLSMVLNESTGISVQTTSPTSGNSNIRIQGLDGRYTQIVQDGFPLYGGLSSGLSIMQIPPLDLRQVEVVKGSASTIYGGGAIAGMINLVSRGAAKERELDLMMDQSSAGGTTLNGFFSDRPASWAYSLFGSANMQTAYDADQDGYSDIPRVSSLHVKPVYYRDGETLRFSFGLDGHWEDRRGGLMDAVKGGSDGYAEKNVSRRATSLLKVEYDLAAHHQWTIKNSVSSYTRQTTVPNYRFEGRQWSTFSEITLASLDERNPWIVGGMVVSDYFDERKSQDAYSTDYSHLTLGVFGQYTWTATERLSVESGMRFDHQNRYGGFLLPRVSLLYKFDTRWSARAGAGMGYREPTVFNDEAETVHFMNVRPIEHRIADAERSVGGNLDINFNGIVVDKVGCSLNQLFYYTSIRDPLGLNPDSSLRSIIAFETVDGTLVTRGAETNIKLSYEAFKLFIGYTLTLADQKHNGHADRLPLIPTHRLNSVVMYEIEGRWRLGYEAYYTGSQRRRDGLRTSDYWIMGVMGERKWERFSLYVNFENFLDTRQSRYEKIVPPDQPSATMDIWAPLEGFTVNGGLKFRL